MPPKTMGKLTQSLYQIGKIVEMNVVNKNQYHDEPVVTLTWRNALIQLAGDARQKTVATNINNSIEKMLTTCLTGFPKYLPR